MTFYVNKSQRDIKLSYRRNGTGDDFYILLRLRLDTRLHRASYEVLPLQCKKYEVSIWAAVPSASVESIVSLQTICPQATIDRLSLTVCVCVCTLHVHVHAHVFVCVPAQIFVCSVCVKDSCSFCSLVGPRAIPHPACPNAPFFRGQRWIVIILRP